MARARRRVGRASRARLPQSGAVCHGQSEDSWRRRRWWCSPRAV
ncbi:Hypothetical protein AA314_09102 [Archangium gephyra]|uniref:Uncharacterized protein n=1 Tax=Archangium gephyra TaxID=48 RepID=A0AAC8QI64_9BACT|nr:Hypothetical protein AA314_09102 [Archangium gephyra]